MLPKGKETKYQLRRSSARKPKINTQKFMNTFINRNRKISLLYIKYTSEITSDFLSQHPSPKGKKGFSLDGEDPPEKVG